MAIDWSTVYQEHRGHWVALADDEQTVIAAGKTAKEAWEHARRLGHEKPILAKMPPELVGYAGGFA